MSTQLIDLLRDWSGQLYSPMKNMLFAHEHPISKSTARLVWAALFAYEDFVFLHMSTQFVDLLRDWSGQPYYL